MFKLNERVIKDGKEQVDPETRYGYFKWRSH